MYVGVSEHVCTSAPPEEWQLGGHSDNHWCGVGDKLEVLTAVTVLSIQPSPFMISTCNSVDPRVRLSTRLCLEVGVVTVQGCVYGSPLVLHVSTCQPWHNLTQIATVHRRPAVACGLVATLAGNWAKGACGRSEKST